ncbi:hypothetical protein DAEQUDRAFT_154705 [Daedalea quercina L-15889]|uniref:Uncharacterized protein n=1 Tax=Daedalea quercina L-15889 TaxID=1314783 RepID=A0A165RN81_9APHY|nr:hypothetical protein DAEQUDRAFT_154705 [Daedalea quercina L-15889]
MAHCTDSHRNKYPSLRDWEKPREESCSTRFQAAPGGWGEHVAAGQPLCSPLRSLSSSLRLAVLGSECMPPTRIDFARTASSLYRPIAAVQRHGHMIPCLPAARLVPACLSRRPHCIREFQHLLSVLPPAHLSGTLTSGAAADACLRLGNSNHLPQRSIHFDLGSGCCDSSTWTAVSLARTEDCSPIRSSCQSYTQVLVCSQSKPDANVLLYRCRYRLSFAHTIVRRRDNVIRSTISRESRDESLISVELPAGKRLVLRLRRIVEADGPGGSNPRCLGGGGICGDHTLKTTDQVACGHEAISCQWTLREPQCIRVPTSACKIQPRHKGRVCRHDPSFPT